MPITDVTLCLALPICELARVLGISQPLTSHLLTGKRNLTVAHMRKLESHFRIDPGYFL